MFRYGNVGTLKTTVGKNMAMRRIFSGNTCWPRVGGLIVQRVPQQIGRRTFGLSPLRAAGGARSYATDAGENDEEPSTPEDPAPRRYMEKGKQPLSLFDIAKEGKSPKLQDVGKEQFKEQKGRDRSNKKSLYDVASGLRKDIVAAEKELAWIQDPAELANRVEDLLRRRNVRFAATLVRTSQKQGYVNTTVAWNHLMGYCLKANEPQAAWKFYNEMKKRGRKPNERTYTLMLAGLGRCDKQPGFNNVKTALSIYESIFEAKTDIKPGVVYANAIMTTCLRQGNFDALWTVAADLPEDGPLAPDAKTYTLIFRAINASLENDLSTMPRDQLDNIPERRQKAVVEAKRVWSEVVYLWKEGRLPMDSRLANSMAEILLQGNTDPDCYDVFSLYRQLCGIPVLVKEPPREVQKEQPRRREAQKEHVPDRSTEYIPFVNEDEELYRHPEDSAGQMEAKEGEELEEEENFDGLFDPVVPETATGEEDADEKKPALTHMPVENQEISYLLEACMLMTQGLGAGKAYWQYFLDHGYRDKLHSGTSHQYLRLLRKAHSSRLTLELIRDEMVPSGQAEGKTFHIALSCCRRDRNNPNVIKHTNEILQLMNENLELPDPRVIEGYHDFIQGYELNPHRLITLNGFGVEKSSSNRGLEALGRELRVKLQLLAEATLRPHIAKLHEAMQQDTRPANTKERSTKSPDIPGSAALKVMLRTRGLIDNLLKRENAALISKEDRELLEAESRKLREYSTSESHKKFKNSFVKSTKAQPRREEDDDE